MKPKIAIIEDELPIAERTKECLEKAGYAAEIFLSVEEAKPTLKSERYDAWLLDINMNGDQTAGISLATWAIEMQLKVPTLVVSGLPPSPYKAITRAMGLWDFLTKPIDYDDLLYKLRQLLDAGNSPSPELPDIQGLEIDRFFRTKPKWNGSTLPIAFTPLRVLTLLVENAGETVTYANISRLQSSQSRDATRQCIQAIRNAFTDVDPDFQKIKAVTGEGYKWVK